MTEIDPTMAVDLSKHAEQQEAAAKARAAAVAAEHRRVTTERIARWDRAMRRAFKGIMPVPQRHMWLRRGAAIEDARRG